MTSVEDLPDEALRDEITTWAGRIAAGEARLLELIGEFDKRQAWAGVGLLSCAHWLSLRCGMGMKAGHERVRVARALGELPLIAAAFKAGRLSWTQVRAITRVATTDDEQTYLDIARHATGAQIERMVRGVRRVHKIIEDEADPERAAYRMRTRISYDTDGTMAISIRLPAEQGAVLLAAIEQARAGLDARHRQSSAQDARSTSPAGLGSLAPAPSQDGVSESSAEDSVTSAPRPGICESSAEDGVTSAPPPVKPDRPAPATLAEGLMDVVRTFLDTKATEQPDLTRRHRSRLAAQIDPLSGWARLHDGELLPPTSVPPALTAAIAGVRLRPLTEADLTRHDLGRTAREPNLALRELIGTIDGERCRFPGCTRRRRLHAHHVTEWTAGGPTDLANLALVCSRHHTLIHSQGLQMTLHGDRTLNVATATGVPVLHHPALPWQPAEDLDPQRNITASTLPPRATDPLHLGYVVGVLMQQAA